MGAKDICILYLVIPNKEQKYTGGIGLQSRMPHKKRYGTKNY